MMAKQSEQFDPAVRFRAVVRMALDHVVKYRGTPLAIAAVTLIACARREYRAELKRRKITVH